MKTGAFFTNDGCSFSVWAPEKKSMLLHIVSPIDMKAPMAKDEDGCFSVKIAEVPAGAGYFFMPDGEKDYPDPASHFQPEGVHGASSVVDHSSFRWNDNAWKGIPAADLILYEMHVGTFTPEGTFDSVIMRLDELAETGINGIELMPVSQFPGSRNWGYDGVFPYSVQNTYGGPDGLKKLVDAAHQRGIAVFLDVVYNHLGPEGNYFGKYGPYFTKKYKVSWGDAINLDDAWCDGVREYFSENLLHWFVNYHIDGIRADAIHMMFDFSAVHFWEVAYSKVKLMEQKQGRKFFLFAESDLNSPKVVKSPESGGYGFDAQWLDDFHHALYVLLHPEGRDRYEDFGSLEQLAKAYTDGFVHSGEFVKFRKHRHGASSAGIPGEKFVAFNQNHDQVGNRVLGERLCMLTGFDQMKMAAAALILSPYIPLLFMGEEYGDENPFFYFISHSDKALIKAVREGRKKEFESYRWKTDPPDPQDESTFLKSKISWEKRYSGKHRLLLDWNRELIGIRKNHPAMKNTRKDGIFVYIEGVSVFFFVRTSDDGRSQIVCILNFSGSKAKVTAPSGSPGWRKILDSTEPRWSQDEKTAVPAPGELKAEQQITMEEWSVIVYSN